MNLIAPRPIIIYAAIAILCIVANIIAFCFQFFCYEIPCPLCLLQRFGFIAIGFGATASIAHKPSWKYDLIIIISSIFTLIVGLRQVLLHIMPHDPGYGSMFLGLHFYTWSAIMSFALILLMAATSIVNLVTDKFEILQSYPVFLTPIFKISFITITFINLVFTFFECGFGLCPSDPLTYLEWDAILDLFRPLHKK